MCCKSFDLFGSYFYHLGTWSKDEAWVSVYEECPELFLLLGDEISENSGKWIKIEKLIIMFSISESELMKVKFCVTTFSLRLNVARKLLST